MQFGAVKEPVKDRLIFFWQRTLERYPSAAFCFNEG
jgi:hypothetical protein